MATIHSQPPGPNVPPARDERPYYERYKAPAFYRGRDHEFDAVKMGVWLFLGTEILLFSGMFVSYAILRMMHPEAFINGSHYLDWRFGFINTVVLLVSSYTVAAGVRAAQVGDQKWLRRNILITLVCGVAFLAIKGIFEYYPKAMDGKLPGIFFAYPNSQDPYEPLWWSVYWIATGIHASHVIVGIGLFIWLYVRSRKLHFGPTHYNAVEGVGLYWHIVDIVWIFLFPMLYLIH